MNKVIKTDFANEIFSISNIKPIHARMKGSSTQAYLIHRQDIKAIFPKYKDNLKAPCVYLLFSSEMKDGKIDVYIGETADWYGSRKKDHLVDKKNFWDAICLVTDMDLHRTFIRRIEYELYQNLKKNSNLNIHTLSVSKEFVPNDEMNFINEFISKLKFIISEMHPTLHSIVRELGNSEPNENEITLYEKLQRSDRMLLKSSVFRDLTNYYTAEELGDRTFSRSEVYFAYDPTVNQYAFTILPGSTIFKFNTQWIDINGKANIRGRSIDRYVIDDPDDPYKYLVVKEIECRTQGDASLIGRADQQHGKDFFHLESGKYLLQLKNEYKENRDCTYGRKIKEIQEEKEKNDLSFH